MVVPLNTGTPIWTPKYHNPYYRKHGTSDFGKPAHQVVSDQFRAWVSKGEVRLTDLWDIIGFRVEPTAKGPRTQIVGL